MPKKTRKKKHIPQRTCVGCREVLPKRSLIRVVRTPDAVVIDGTGKLPGRGAYLHDRRTCWDLGLKSGLAHALKTELTEADREKLVSFRQNLPDELPSDDGNPAG